MMLCSPNEKQGKENFDRKWLSDDTKFKFGATKDHGHQLLFKRKDSNVAFNICLHS